MFKNIFRKFSGFAYLLVFLLIVESLGAAGAHAIDSCSSRYREYNDIAYGGSGFTLIGCANLPEGAWQQMEQDTVQECENQAYSIVTAHTLECLSFCTSDVSPSGQLVQLHCLPMPTLPPLPPAGCSQITHNIWDSGQPGGGCSNAVWQYNFQSQATLKTKCNCIDNPGPPITGVRFGSKYSGTEL